MKALSSRFSFRTRRFKPLLLLPIVCWAAPAVHAVNFSQLVSSDWFDAGNWYYSVPTLSDDANIYGGKTAVIAAPGATANWLSIALPGPGSGTLTIQGTGTLSLNSGLNVNGGGLLTIQSGGTLSGGSGFIGYQGTGNATVAVTGSGSSWTSGFTVVGWASGTSSNLNITAGGAVTANGDTYIGNNGTGNVTVDGVGSTFSNPFAANRTLRVGYLNTGTLSITGGGAVTSGTTMIGSGNGVRGSVIVSGLGSLWTNTSNTVVGYGSGSSGSGSLTFEQGAQGTTTSITVGTGSPGDSSLTITGSGSSLSAPGFFSVGLNSNASTPAVSTVTVSNGGSLLTASSASARIGGSGGGTAVVLVTDVGSTWSNPSSLSIGVFGLGYVTIKDGATATAGPVSLSANSSSKITITGANSQWTTGTFNLEASTIGTNSLEVTAGGTLTSAASQLGSGGTGTPAALISGTNSLWSATSLNVGYSTNASVTVAAGGRLSSTGAVTIAYAPGSVGNLSISGTGSQLSANSLVIASSGTGNFQLGAGATATTTSAAISSFVGAVGTATITGAGTQWNVGALTLGAAGTSSLTVSDGAILSSDSAILRGWIGSLLVTGTGSRWNTNSFSTEYGASSAGSITVTDGGLLSIAGGSGALSLSSQTGTFPRQIFIGTGGLPGTIAASSINTDGLVTFDFTGSLDFAVPVKSYSKIVKNGPGTLTLSGASNFTGGLTINSGTLRATTNPGAMGNGPITLSGGSLVLANDTPLLFGYPYSALYLTLDSTVTVDRLTAGAGVEHTLSTLYLGAQQTFSVSAGSNITSGVASLAFGGARFQGDSTIQLNTGTRLSLLSYADNGSAYVITKTGPGLLNLVTGSQATPGTTFVVKEGMLQEGTTNDTANVNIVLDAIAGKTATYRLDDINHKVLSLTFGGSAGSPTSFNTADTGDSTLTVIGPGITYNATGNPQGAVLSGTVWLPGNQIINVGDSTNASSDLTISADMFGSFIKQGSGTLTLSGNNFNLTAMTVVAGTVRATTQANALGAYNPTLLNVPVTLAGGSLALANNSGLNFATRTVVQADATISSDRLTPGAGVTHALGQLSIGAQNLSIKAGSNVTGGTAGVSFVSGSLSGVVMFDVSSSASLQLGPTSNGTLPGAITKTGAGTLILAGEGTFTGPLAVNGGRVELQALRASASASGLSVNSGATLALTGSAGTTDRISDTAPFTLAGGTLALGGLSENAVGPLNLSLTSIIDFNGGTTSLIKFGGITHTGGILRIVGWQGVGYGGTERLLFKGNAADFTNAFAQNEVEFNGVFGYQTAAYGGVNSGVYELVAIPEPSTWISCGLFLGIIGYRYRRRLLR